MQFNKLYNLILLSIITLNKAYRRQMLYKNDWNKFGIEAIEEFLLKFDNKTADFLCKYIANNTIKERIDKRIAQVEKILALNPSIDTQNFKGTLDLFIEQNKEILSKHLQKVAAKKVLQLDKIPQFSLKKLYDHGVVIYRVELSEAGMNAVRKIINLQLGEDTNPWCLISRPMEQAWKYWIKYNSYPKHIAFQNGKLFAFCANHDLEILWWNLQDKASKTLFTPDFQQINIKLLYKWSPEEQRLIFIKAKGLIYNELTGRYDANDDVRILDWDLIDNHLPVPFGVIRGDFICYGCGLLIDLTNGPTEVYGKFNCADCHKLASLEGGPTRVHGEFICYGDHNLFSLKGAPKRVGGKFWCYHCNNIKTFEGAPEYVGGDFQASLCHSLLSLVGSPKIVGGDYDVRYCEHLKNLLGAPETVKGEFVISYTDIESLKGGPEKLGGSIVCFDCDKLQITTEDLHKYLIYNLNRSY